MSRSRASDIASLLSALEHEKRGDWNRAHELVSNIESAEAAWVHAYLHRREGDQSNAAYWYRQAGKPIDGGSLDDERRSIVAALQDD